MAADGGILEVGAEPTIKSGADGAPANVGNNTEPKPFFVNPLTQPDNKWTENYNRAFPKEPVKQNNHRE